MKQGCCVSPLLLVMVVELMAIRIRNNPNIYGITFKRQNLITLPSKILQYADDATLTLQDKKELDAAIRDVDAFSLISGLKLNKNKSHGIWIGNTKYNTDTPGDINWVKCGEVIKILGIYFCANKEASDINLNWEPRIETIKHLIRKWQRRNLSLYGKIIVCKTFLLSQISYTIQALALPDEVLNTLDTLLFKFIWQKKFSNKKAREKIKRNVICQSFEEGGLNMISVKAQQKVFLSKWIKKAIEEKDGNESETKQVDIIFNSIGGFDYFLSSSTKYEQLKLPSTMPRFWKSVVKTWVELKRKENKAAPNNLEYILNEPLFNNINILYRGNPLFFNTWVKSGVKHVYQIIDKGKIKTKDELEQLVGQYAGLHFDYYALINAIPNVWKDMITKNTPVDWDILVNQYRNKYDDALSLVNKNNWAIRRKFMPDLSESCGKRFWFNKTGINITHKFHIARSATKETRLRLLHFKILHNIYPSNIMLNKMGLKDSDQCEHCGDTDYIEHMFIHCPRLNGFWSSVFQTIHTRINVSFPMTDTNILLGIDAEGKDINKNKINIANHIILIAKMSVSKMKYGTIKQIFVIFEIELSIRDKYLL